MCKMVYIYLIFIILTFFSCVLVFYKKHLLVFDWITNVFYPPCLKPLSKGIFLPSARDERLEEGEKNLLYKNDSMTFIGVDNHGNKIITKLTRLSDCSLEVLIALYLSNGVMYTKKCETAKATGMWSAGCLLFELIEPMKNWRISFNGALKSNENIEEHVRINLIWRAFCQPYLYKNNRAEENKINLSLEYDDIGYEQWGAIFGTINVGTSFEDSFHFMSLRERYWGNEKWSNVFGFSEDGKMFSIGVSHDIKFGHIRFPKGVITNFVSDCPEFTSFSSFPDDLKFNLLGKENYAVNLKCNHKTHLSSKNLHLVSFNGYCSADPIEGFILIWDSHHSKDVTPKSVKGDNKETEVLFLPLDSPLCTYADLVGKKGASLAVLTGLENASNCKLKATVPQGFCLTKMAMELQIQSSRELKAAVRNLVQRSPSIDITQACQRIQDVWLNTKVCSEIRYILSKQIAVHVPYAVRSSGISEDNTNFSSAGQNATYLGRVGLESILLAIQKCWASLYSFQFVQYRRLHGLPLKSSMGIVIQKMVAAEIAGVMFTCDPVTGNPFETVISANYGLGETVVSSAVESDSFKLERKRNSLGDTEFIIKSEECGKKTHQISMTSNGLIVKLNLDDFSANSMCMSEDEAKILAKIGMFLEEELGNSCDIEWAILKGTVYLLQCQPVTTLHAWRDEELLHEFDSALLPNDVTSTAYTGEVLPGATSVLSQSLLGKAVDVAISFHPNENFNIDDIYNNVNFVTSGHHVFIHIFNTFLSKIEKERSSALTAAELAICGHIIINDYLYKQALSRNGIINHKMKIKTILDHLNSMWWCNLITKETEEDAVNFSIFHKDCLSAKELIELIDQNLFQLEKVARRHSFVTKVNVFCQVILLVILLEGQKDLTIEHFEDVSAVLQGCSSVISAEIPSDLEDIASKISECDNSEEFCKMPTNLAKHWMKVHCPEAAHLLSKFLIHHGHRSNRELDFETETWGLNNTPLIANLQILVRGGSRKEEKCKAPEEIDDIIKNLKTPTKSSTRRILRFIFPFCRKSSEQQEVTKNSFLLIVHSFRIAFNQLGNLMVRENYLPHPKLIFFCTYYEIKKLLTLRESIILHKAMRRQHLWEQWHRLKFPEIMTGLPKPLTPQNSSSTDGNIRVSGTLVCPGRVEGRACVVVDLQESCDVRSGDILITNTMDVGWSPLFPIISGIVTEIGGLISHGAVVAREYGVPCIAGAASATSLFKTGDHVILDGAASCIYKTHE